MNNDSRVDDAQKPVDLDELERLAKAATDGPWIMQEDCGNCKGRHIVESRVESEMGEYGSILSSWHPEVVGCCLEGGLGPNVDRWVAPADAAFIAAANPQTVLALIARLRALSAAVPTISEEREELAMLIGLTRSNGIYHAADAIQKAGYRRSFPGAGVPPEQVLAEPQLDGLDET